MLEIPKYKLRTTNDYETFTVDLLNKMPEGSILDHKEYGRCWIEHKRELRHSQTKTKFLTFEKGYSIEIDYTQTIEQSMKLLFCPHPIEQSCQQDHGDM